MRDNLIEFIKNDGGCVLAEQIATWAHNNYGTTDGLKEILASLQDQGILEPCGNNKGFRYAK